MDAQNKNKEDIGILDEFQLEFVEFWRRLPNKVFFFALVAAWLALFQFFGNSTFGYIDTPSLFRWMIGAYNSPSGDDGHGFLVPFVVLGLFWWKQKELVALPLNTWWPGLVLVVLAVVSHLFGYVVQLPQISIAGFFLGLYGVLGMAWGFRFLRASAFPFFLFVFCVPLGGYGQIITLPLRLLATRLVEFVCHNLLAIDVMRQGTQLTDPAGQYQYEVVAACGGIRSLVAILALATIFGFVVFRSPWKRCLMIASAFPLAVIGNVTRLLSIIIAAEFGGQSAGDYVHEGGPLGVLSLLPYVPAILGLILLERLLKKPEQSENKAAR